ncbi:MAG TPA: hypothetical protein VE959_16915 [Bryobacteraceae bacterium]|nr:hypothetical protein [Bryobacteraceae bacterium]
MNIDDRIEKLTERVDALTHSVELLATFHRDNEQRMGQMIDAITRLANIAGAHERRLTDLEDQP